MKSFDLHFNYQVKILISNWNCKRMSAALGISRGYPGLTILDFGPAIYIAPGETPYQLRTLSPMPLAAAKFARHIRLPLILPYFYGGKDHNKYSAAGQG